VLTRLIAECPEDVGGKEVGKYRSGHKYSFSTILVEHSLPYEEINAFLTGLYHF